MYWGDDMSIFNDNVSTKLGVDTSKDTVTAETLLKGVTAHDASGKQITGIHVCQTSGSTAFLGSFVSAAGSPIIAMQVK